MAETSTTFETEHASRYLRQLCKHFGQKVRAEFDSRSGQIEFPFGTCELKATDTALTLTAWSGPDTQDKLESVLSAHLARFAFREAPKLIWRRTSSPEPKLNRQMET